MWWLEPTVSALGGGGGAKGDQPWLHKLEETLREEGKREGREEIREAAGKEEQD